jgi:hypothetical protein
LTTVQAVLDGRESTRQRFRLFLLQDGTCHVQIVDAGGYEIHFDEDLARMLGLADRYRDRWIDRPGNTVRGQPVEMNGGLDFLMLYSDVGENVRIGNRNGRILRCISSSGAGGSTGLVGGDDMVALHFPNIYYVPVARSRLDSVHIGLYTDFGQQVRFLRGKTLVVLHFRRR